MFPKKNRLPAHLIPRLLKKGRRFSSAHLNLIVSRQEKKQPSLAGFIVPVRVLRKSSQRNYYRRCLKQAVREKWGQVKPGYHLIFLLKKNEWPKNPAQIIVESQELLKKAKLLKSQS